MMFILASLTGFIFGLIRGGRFKSVLFKRFRCLPLLLVSLTFALLLGSRPISDWLSASAAEGILRSLMAFLQMAAMAGFAWVNRRKPGILIILLGGVLNSLVITFNAGRMPVGSEVRRFGENALAQIEQTPHYFLATGGEPLAFLADNIPLWTLGWYMVSIGDFLIAIGLFFLAAYLPRPVRRKKRPPSELANRDFG